MNCPKCGSSLWDGSQCSACGLGKPTGLASPPTPHGDQENVLSWGRMALRGVGFLVLLYAIGFPLAFFVLSRFGLFLSVSSAGDQFVVQQIAEGAVWGLAGSGISLVGFLWFLFVNLLIRAPAPRPGEDQVKAAHEKRLGLAWMGGTALAATILVGWLIGYFLPPMRDRVFVTDHYVETAVHPPFFAAAQVDRAEFQELYNFGRGGLGLSDIKTDRYGKLRGRPNLLVVASSEVDRRAGQKFKPLSWSPDHMYSFRFHGPLVTQTLLLQNNKLVILTRAHRVAPFHLSFHVDKDQQDLVEVLRTHYAFDFKERLHKTGWLFSSIHEIPEKLMPKVKEAVIRKWDAGKREPTPFNWTDSPYASGIERSIFLPSGERAIWTIHGSYLSDLTALRDELSREWKKGSLSGEGLQEWLSGNKVLSEIINQK